MSGWAILEASNGELVDAGMTFHTEIDMVLVGLFEQYEFERIVCESFKLFRHKAIEQTGSKFYASQVIGKLELLASIHKVPVTYQPPNILPIAEKLSQVKRPKVHKYSHATDAYLHGIYWLRKQGRYTTPLENEMRLRQ